MSTRRSGITSRGGWRKSRTRKSAGQHDYESPPSPPTGTSPYNTETEFPLSWFDASGGAMHL